MFLKIQSNNEQHLGGLCVCMYVYSAAGVVGVRGVGWINEGPRWAPQKSSSNNSMQDFPT